MKRTAHQINKGGIYKEKLNEISQYTLNRFIEATERGKIVHDIDLRRWALIAHKNFMNSDAPFEASKNGWISLKEHIAFRLEKLQNLLPGEL